MVHCVVLSQVCDTLCVQQNVLRECIRQQEIQYNASSFEACCRSSFCLEADAAGCTALPEWKQQGRKTACNAWHRKLKRSQKEGARRTHSLSRMTENYD